MPSLLTTLTDSELSAEWSREFYYEARRRTDLIRFKKFSDNSFRTDFPIPQEALEKNTNLQQNESYSVPQADDVKFSRPSFANDKVMLDSIVALSFSWNKVSNEDGDFWYVLSAGKDQRNSEQLAKTDGTTASIGGRALQKIANNYYPREDEADIKVFITAYISGYELSTDSVTIHVIPANNAYERPWFIIGSCVGDGGWSNSQDGIGKSTYPMVFGDNIIHFQQGDMFKFVKANGNWSEQIGSTDGSISNIAVSDGGSSNINITETGWYNVSVQSPSSLSITPLADYQETTYKTVTLSDGSQTLTMNPMSSREHEVEYFSLLTVSKATKVSIEADGTFIAKDVKVKAGTYDVFVNTQSKTYSIFKADGSSFDSRRAWGEIVNSLSPTPATGVGTIDLGNVTADSVQVVNIGRINPSDEVHNAILMVGDNEVKLSDDGKCAVSDLKSNFTSDNPTQVRFYAEYKSDDITTRRWSEHFDITIEVKRTETKPSATITDSDGKQYGMAKEGNDTIGYAYLSGTVTVNNGDKSWTETVSTPGFYRAQIVSGSETLTLTKINTIGMIGDFNSWGNEVPMTYNAEENCWEGTLTLTGSTTMKFRANNLWDLSWGCLKTTDALSGLLAENEDNIRISIPGSYAVKVYLTYPGDSRYVFTTVTGISAPTLDSKSVKIYNLNGVEVKSPKPGVYIVHKGTTTKKIVIR